MPRVVANVWPSTTRSCVLRKSWEPAQSSQARTSVTQRESRSLTLERQGIDRHGQSHLFRSTEPWNSPVCNHKLGCSLYLVVLLSVCFASPNWPRRDSTAGPKDFVMTKVNLDVFRNSYLCIFVFTCNGTLRKIVQLRANTLWHGSSMFPEGMHLLKLFNY